MIRKSGRRLSEEIMLKKMPERDDDSKKSHPVLVVIDFVPAGLDNVGALAH
jgi:hypothetical protein